jgi:hypothetical protein
MNVERLISINATVSEQGDADAWMANWSDAVPAPDLTELNEYLVSRVRRDGLIVSAAISPRVRSDVSIGGTHVELRITNPNRSPPLHYNYAVTVARFERDGVHLFDDIVAEAVRDLTRP